MLAAYFRMKYPEVVVGALAASAPIWQFRDFVPCDTFAKIVKRTFQESGTAGTQCVENIANSWAIIDQLGASEQGRAQLTSTFSLCEPIVSQANISTFKDWLVDIYGNLAMADYPYPAGFLEPLPGWPVNAFCQKLAAAPSDPDELLEELSLALGNKIA
jgi:lysosomal Pro-X carboxypeptidase